MDQLKSLTLPSWGRLVIYFALLGTGLALAALAALGYGTYTELPDGGWTYAFEITSVQLNAILTTMIAGGGTAVFALLKGFKSRVGDIPVAERVGDKPLSGPTVDTAAVKVSG